VEPLTDKFSIQARKPVEFNLSFSPETILLQADATLLSNAISNLIDNAIKYSHVDYFLRLNFEFIELEFQIYCI